MRPIHPSTTPHSRLLRKAKGKEVQLFYEAHVLIENRSRLLVNLQVIAKYLKKKQGPEFFILQEIFEKI